MTVASYQVRLLGSFEFQRPGGEPLSWFTQGGRADAYLASAADPVAERIATLLGGRRDLAASLRQVVFTSAISLRTGSLSMSRVATVSGSPPGSQRTWTGSKAPSIPVRRLVWSRQWSCFAEIFSRAAVCTRTPSSHGS